MIYALFVQHEVVHQIFRQLSKEQAWVEAVTQYMQMSWKIMLLIPSIALLKVHCEQPRSSLLHSCRRGKRRPFECLEPADQTDWWRQSSSQRATLGRSHLVSCRAIIETLRLTTWQLQRTKFKKRISKYETSSNSRTIAWSHACPISSIKGNYFFWYDLF